jgi:hypothetical protein
VQDAPAHGLERRQGALEVGPRAAGEDRDVARGRAVTAAGDRAVQGGGAALGDQGGQAAHLGLVGGAHLQPNLARRQAREDPVVGFHHRTDRGRRGQAGNDQLHRLGQLARGFGPVRAALQ